MNTLEALVQDLARRVVREELARHAPAWEWLSVPDAAALLGCTPKAIYSKFDRGVLAKHKFDGHDYVSRRELDLAIRKSTD